MKDLIFPNNYSLELVISAVVTMAVILLIIRIYLKAINKKSGLQKPEWMSDDEFNNKFNKGKR